MDWAMLIALIAIAVAVFFGLWGFRKGVIDKLSSVNERLMAIGVAADKVWDFLTHLRGKNRKDAEKDYEELRTLAAARTVARFSQEHRIIELAKPMTETDNEE